MQGRLTVTEGRRYPLTVGFGKRDLARTVGFGKRDLARTVGFRKRDFENGILKNEIRKTGFGPNSRIRKTGFGQLTHRQFCLWAGQGAGQGRQGRGQIKSIR